MAGLPIKTWGCVMKKINIVHLISKLIKDYEKVHGVTLFEVKKNDSQFEFLYADQKLLDVLQISSNCVVGKTISALPLSEDFKKKLQVNFEKVWNGEEMVEYEFFSNNETIVVYSLKAVLKNGKTYRLEGHCALLDKKGGGLAFAKK